MASQRKIIHVDMDAFYASVEQRDFPELRSRPVAVGGSSGRGVVAASSYEARKFGVRSAMPSVVAARKCPGLIFVETRFEVYREVSAQIREVFKRYTKLVEPLSLDEAYLDVTEPLPGKAGMSATAIAREIRASILSETGLTASAGVSFNKFLAKVGSDHDKPDGLTVIRPAQAGAFIAALSIEKFYGVGPVTARKMNDLGIKNGADLHRFSEDELVLRFGKAGRYYFRIARCEDDRPVSTSRRRKSIGAERTFENNVTEVKEMKRRLEEIAEKVATRMQNAGLVGKTLTLKIKSSDFDISTRQTTTQSWLGQKEELLEMAELLLTHAPAPPSKPVRLLGISVSNLRSISGDPLPEQLRLNLEDQAQFEEVQES